MTPTRFTNRTLCSRGHAWIPDNLYLDSNGHDRCKICKVEHNKKRQRSELLRLRAFACIVQQKVPKATYDAVMAMAKVQAAKEGQERT